MTIRIRARIGSNGRPTTATVAIRAGARLKPFLYAEFSKARVAVYRLGRLLPAADPVAAAHDYVVASAASRGTTSTTLRRRWNGSNVTVAMMIAAPSHCVHRRSELYA